MTPLEDKLRAIAREEVASAFGLILNRLADLTPTPTPEQLAAALKSIAGEGLRDFAATKAEPGPK